MRIAIKLMLGYTNIYVQYIAIIEDNIYIYIYIYRKNIEINMGYV